MFDSDIKKLYEAHNFNEFWNSNGYQKLENIYKIHDDSDLTQVEKLDDLLTYFSNIFISEKLFISALDLYNVKISFYFDHYDHVKLLESINEADAKIDDILKIIDKREPKQEPDNKRFSATYLNFHQKSQCFILNRINQISNSKIDQNTELRNLYIEVKLQSKYCRHYLKLMHLCLEIQFKKYKHQSFTDELTKMHNRRYLVKHYAKYYLLASRLGMKFSVLLMDLDKFKKVNDLYGHLKGDEVLKEVANILKNSFRHTDIKVRASGDEFIVLLFSENNIDLLRVTKDVLDKITSLEFISDSGEKFHIKVSIGIATCEPTEVNDTTNYKAYFEKLIKEADIAMYHSKRNEDKITIYSEKIKNTLK